jgi:hypothetical protein
MAQQLVQSAPTDYALEAEQLARRRKLVEALQQQGMAGMPQGEMVSGRYVRPAFTQQLAQALKAPLAEYQGRKLDEEQKRLGMEARSQKAKDFADALQAGTGTPERTVTAPDMSGQGMTGSYSDMEPPRTQQTAPAVPGSRREMFARLLQSQFPELQQIGMTGITKEDVPLKVGQGDSLVTPDGRLIFKNPAKVDYHPPINSIGPDGKPQLMAFPKDGGPPVPYAAIKQDQFNSPTVDAGQRLSMDMFKHLNLSENQRRQLEVAIANANTSATNAANRGISTQFETGQGIQPPVPFASPQATPQVSPQVTPGQPVTPQTFPKIAPQAQAAMDQDALKIIAQKYMSNPQELANLDKSIAQAQAAMNAAPVEMRGQLQREIVGMQLAKQMASGQAPSPAVPNPAAPAMTGKSQQAVLVDAAKQRTEMEQKRDFNMGGLNDVIAKARTLLETGNPTHSGFGQLQDIGAAFIGQSAKGAPEADQLRALSGALTAKMPRMEGPQSDKDVQLYREMAGQIGNAGLPIARRLAALKTVESLWGKYEKSPTGTRPITQPERRAEPRNTNKRVVVDF